MEVSADPYQKVVSVYIGLVRHDSPQAARAIEQIRATVGSPAALRAALIITVFRMELKQNHWVPDMNVYAYLIKDYLEAIPLLEYALGCCLQAWGVRNFAFVELNMSDPTSRILKRALGPRP